LGYSDLLFLPYVFEIGIPVTQKQAQGQVFTPLNVSKFICNQNISDKTSKILDPACGTGIFLLGTLEFLLADFDRKSEVELIGIEKDLQEILDVSFIATIIREIAITIYIGLTKPNIKDNLLREKRLDKKYSLLTSSITIFIIMFTLSRIGNMKTMIFGSYKMVC